MYKKVYLFVKLINNNLCTTHNIEHQYFKYQFYYHRLINLIITIFKIIISLDIIYLI